MKTIQIIILCNLGGPRNLAEVEVFLQDLLSDPNIIRLPFFLKPLQKLLANFIVKKRLPISQKLYLEIGGKSPLVKITEIQAKLLEKKINKKVFICMRCGKPSILELITALHKYINTLNINKQKSPIEAIIIPLYPQYSTTTTKSSFEQISNSFKKEFPEIKLQFIQSYEKHPKFIQAWVERIKLKLKQIHQSESVLLLFSAHSIPESYIKSGDPYLKQIQSSVQFIMNFFPNNKHLLSFQSRLGPTKWLKPSTESIIQLQPKGKKILIIPIAFVSDHLETIHEIGIELFHKAKKNDITLYRTPGLNNSNTFIECLADLASNYAT